VDARDSITVYSFDPATGAYLGREQAWASPQEPGVYHFPANTTEVKPPAIDADQAAVWDGAKWTVVPDHRGQMAYDTTTGGSWRVETLGALPDGATTKRRPSPQHSFRDGDWRLDAGLQAAELDRLRTAATRSIDARAEQARLRFITPGAGQSLVYAEKRAEAERFLELAHEPESFAGFPLVEAEVLRTRVPAKSIATVWAQKAEAWRRVAATIESIRLDAHDAIAAATDLAAIDVAVDAAIAAFDKVGA